MDVEAVVVRYRDEFYPAGFRKLFALMLVVSVTVLPEVFAWAEAPVPQAGRPGSGRFRPSGGFLPNEAPRPTVFQTIWTVLKTSAVVVVTTLGVALYYPRSGFKRYALVCGPVIALTVPFCVFTYLQGRTEIFRAEVLIVSLIAMLPGVALYIWLTWRKAQSQGMVW